MLARGVGKTSQGVSLAPPIFFFSRSLCVDDEFCVWRDGEVDESCFVQLGEAEGLVFEEVTLFFDICSIGTGEL